MSEGEQARTHLISESVFMTAHSEAEKGWGQWPLQQVPYQQLDLLRRCSYLEISPVSLYRVFNEHCPQLNWH